MQRANRRQWLKGMTGGTLWAALPFSETQAAAGEYQLFWGDLHNHNAVGYARGSLERTYDVARSHLDFLAFTPHAQWHDMPEMPNNAHQKWVKGFAVTKENWPKAQKLAATHNEPGKFVSFLAYEWHSSFFGDYCVYYRGDDKPLKYFNHVRDLQKYARATNTTIIPHHLAYKQGWRGANWDYLDTKVSPVLEIYSEHGLAERDRGPQDYIRHSIGGRWTRNTLREALKKGFRVGVIASSDDHLGYPGAYGEGMVGIYAKELSRESLLEALWARRTIAITGDRIALAATLNGQWMGSILPFTAEREIQVSVTGRDEVERVDVLKNDRVIHRHFPEDHTATGGRWPGEALCRLEFGWGPWAALGMARVCDWEVTATLRDGKLISATPCFQSGPLDEKRRNRILSRTESSCRFQLYTSRIEAFEERATNAVVLHVAGGRNAVLELKLTRPSRMTFRKTLGELAEHNEIEFTGPFTAESFVVHRLVTPDLFRASFRVSDGGKRGQTDWYYVRATQTNGQQAWSSPFWVEG
jgi:hypothetical protein